MPRAFLVVMDSVGIGGAPDAGRFFNGDQPDTGANTIAHIAKAHPGGLQLPTLDALGLGAALNLASGAAAPGLSVKRSGLWGCATEVSPGKDTPTGHWELAGVPVPWEWHTFPDKVPAFPPQVVQAVTQASGTDGILGNCHAAGLRIMRDLGAEHLRTGWPICYTSADSVFQIAAHEEAFGLDRLLDLCRSVAPLLHDMRVGRVIARPFAGDAHSGFRRTQNRRDFAIPPPSATLCDWVQDAGGKVRAIGKIGDIFSMKGIDDVVKGSDAQLMAHLFDAIETAQDQSLTFANFVEFDSLYGHRRDVAGYAQALEWFDSRIAALLPRLRAGDMLLLTADHGNDPTWSGTDHTRERVPVLIAGCGAGELGQIAFTDVAASIAAHLGVPSQGPGQNCLPRLPNG
jgi:phosphopentomutase